MVADLHIHNRALRGWRGAVCCCWILRVSRTGGCLHFPAVALVTSVRAQTKVWSRRGGALSVMVS